MSFQINTQPLHLSLLALSAHILMTIHFLPAREPVNPCFPSPCGPYSECRVLNGGAACSCKPTYIGAPPQCRPECVVNAECANHLACIQEKCVDPCPGKCGINAQCSVRNHDPKCTCLPGYNGDPYSRCVREIRKFTITFGVEWHVF